METSVGTYGSVRYTVDVRYWECPLVESPLYIGLPYVASRQGSPRSIPQTSGYISKNGNVQPL